MGCTYFSWLLWWRVGAVWSVVALLGPVIGFAAICAVTALVVILINSTLWHRMPAVRDNGEAAAGAIPEP